MLLLAKVKIGKDGIPEVKFYINELDFYGTIDRLVKLKDSWCLHEYKTVSILSPSLIKAAEFKMQDRIYAVGAHFIGKNVKNIKHIFLQKAKIRIKNKETAEEYCERLKLEYTLSQHKYYVEINTCLTRHDLNNTYTNLKLVLKTIRRTKEYYKNTDLCVNRYGECEFFDICHYNLTMAYEKKEEPSCL